MLWVSVTQEDSHTKGNEVQETHWSKKLHYLLAFISLHHDG